MSSLVAGCSFAASPENFGRFNDLLRLAKTDNLSFICQPLAQRRDPSSGSFSPRLDLAALTADEWSNAIVGIVSSDACAEACGSLGHSSVVKDEIDWAMVSEAFFFLCDVGEERGSF